MNPFSVVDDFERAVADYTGAPYCVAVNSCTNALLLACLYCKVETVSIPKRTYVGVAQSILNAGGQIEFDERQWMGSYSLNPYPIRDSARRFTGGMYRGGYDCVSFHVAKVLGIDQGGAILHSDAKADKWFRRARFDGRTPGVAPKDDDFIRGYHFYLSPPLAAMGLWRMNYLPKDNPDLPNDDYPDLSQQKIFQTDELDRIERIRGKNNARWMGALRRLRELDPEFFSEWQAGVRDLDNQISEVNSRL